MSQRALPLLLTLPVRSSASTEQIAGRSTVMIGAGYMLAAVSPVGLGAARDASGTFHTSLIILAGIGVVLTISPAMTIRTARSWTHDAETGGSPHGWPQR